VPLLLPSPASCLWGISPPPSSALRVPCPLCYMSFLLLLLIIQFSFPWGCHSVQGAMLIWPRIVCGSTTCHLAHIPKPSGCWHLAAAQEPSWFLRLTWSGDAMRRLEVCRSQSFASFWWFVL
jgi:hypothetical protein